MAQYFTVTTPFGADVMKFRTVRGSEALSTLFEYDVEMVSTQNSASFATIVGKPMTVTLEFTTSYKRYIHGIVEQFTQGRSDVAPQEKTHLTLYRAKLRPWLWMLTLTKNCQIFQNMTVPAIINDVFTKLGFRDYRSAVTGTYTPREYCVQYEETAFEFISRLMEDEGIYYYFEHTASKHTLVYADDAASYATVVGYPTVRYWEAEEASYPEDTVGEILLNGQVVSGKFAVDDFNFETPKLDLMSETKGKTKTSTMRVYEYQEFQGGFTKKADGSKISKKRIEALEWPEKMIRGRSYCVGFIAGGKFTLKDHPRTDLNAQYVLRSLSVSASLHQYVNTFEALPATVTCRPPISTRKPRIAGTQTAIVTGKKGEEIWTDKYGRIKVQFHWDQLGKLDDKTTCWIRVSQGWAGKAWGRFFLPRIGQEVVVSFINGDPDRPLVTGSVYNAEQTVPYALPANQTKSTWKTRSSKGGGVEDYNEIRFEDKKGKEELYVHAQKDMNIMVEYDRTKKVLNNETNVIKMTRHTTIEQKDEILIVSKGKRDTQVNTGNETHFNQANFSHKVIGNYSLKITGNLTIDVTGNITIKSAMNVDIKAGINMKSTAGVNMDNKAGVMMTMKAGVMLKTDAGVMTDNKAGVMMKNKAGVMLQNEGGVMMQNKGGVMLINEGGVMQMCKAGAMLMIKAGIVMIN